MSRLSLAQNGLCVKCNLVGAAAVISDIANVTRDHHGADLTG